MTNRAEDILILVEPIDGKAPLSSTGMVDKRLFTGENKLHAKQDMNGLWYLEYDMGVLPQPLKNRFTNWNMLIKFVEAYFAGRNIRIKEIVD